MKWLVDEAYPDATVIRLVLDNLNTHKLGSLYEAFAPSEARRIAKRLELHHTPNHGSWLKSSSASSGNSSELRGKEQLTASLEGVQVLGAPGAEEGSQRHLALGAMHRAGTAADLATDYQGPQAPFGRVVVRWRVRLSHEDKQFLDKAFDASAEFALNRHRVFQEGLAAGQQRPLKLSLGQPALSPGGG